jgi:hypothetical protein
MNRAISIFTIIVVLFLVDGEYCNGQKISCKATVSLEKMPLENQTKLAYLQAEITDYINNYAWSDDEYQYDLNCEMEIAMDEAMRVSYEDRYSATIIISNGIDLQYSDKRWIFTLNQGERLLHSNNFHPFTSFIDFYVYLILAYEYDKLADLGGGNYYDLAKQINESAKFTTQYYRGWDRRNDLIAGLLSDANIPYRKLIFHYYTGYYFYEADDSVNATGHLLNAVKLLSQVPKDNLKRFLDLNYINLSRALKDLKLNNEVDYVKSMNHNTQ